MKLIPRALSLILAGLVSAVMVLWLVYFLPPQRKGEEIPETPQPPPPAEPLPKKGGKPIERKPSPATEIVLQETGGAPEILPERPGAPEQGLLEKTSTPPPPEGERDSWEWLREGKLRPFQETCFEDFTPEEEMPSPDEIKQWLAPDPGGSGRISLSRSQQGDVLMSRIRGLLKLKAPWPDRAVLRLSLHDHDNFQIHLWHGSEGITLRHAGHPPGWAAYRSRRGGGRPQPESLALAATDEHRYQRSSSGTFELRFQEASLVMSRGDLVLLRAPLAGPPREVYLEGTARVRGITMYRGEPMTLPSQDPGKSILQSTAPASLDWKEECPPGSGLKKLPSGQVVLMAEKTSTPARGSVEVGLPGLYEIIFKVEDPSPGTGIYLGDESGHPLYQVAFFRDKPTGWMSFEFLKPEDSRTESSQDPREGAIPYSGNSHWLRLILGPGNLKCWTSGDGISWSRALEPLRDEKGLRPYSRLGLFCLGTQSPTRIQLDRIEVRELPTLSAELKENTELPASGDLEDWLKRALEIAPPGADTFTWLRTCTIGTLAKSPPADLGNQLILHLLREQLKRKAPLAARIQLLEDAALLADTWKKETADEFVRLYEQLGKILDQEGNPRPYTAISRCLMASPICSASALDAFPGQLARLEILKLVYGGAWKEVRQLCRRLRFYRHHSDPQGKSPREFAKVLSLALWAEALAAQNLPEEFVRKTPLPPVSWRHPLLVDFTREGYNLIMEFHAAVNGRSYFAACQIISSAKMEGLGLLPHSKDSDLLVSFPAAAARAMREHPGLLQTMREEFGPLGLLRVNRAVASGDPVTLQWAALQFPGTEAAAEAHRWLGDRFLSGGRFAEALGHYQRALQGGPQHLHGQVAPRLRLSGALLGEDLFTPVQGPVDLNGNRLEAAEFEKIISGLLENRRESGGGTSARNPAPPPALYTIRTRLENKRKESLGQVTGGFPLEATDWAARQIAASLAGDLLFASNRYQVAAFNLSRGEEIWVQGLLHEQGKIHDWPLVPMKPVVFQEKVLARQLSRNGPELHCLDRKTGGRLWRSGSGEPVRSDPLIVQDQVHAFTASPARDGAIELQWTSFDLDSGAVLDQRPVARLRDAWGGQVPCQAVRIRDRIVATAGGCVFSCDLQGKPHWLRRQIWLPREESWLEQYREPPLVIGDRVFVCQPGVESIDCLDLESGVRDWQEHIPRIRQICPGTEERLIIRAGEALLALDTRSGEIIWRREIPLLHRVEGCGRPGGLLCTTIEQSRTAQNQWTPTLVWIDVRTGKEKGRSPLWELSGNKPKIGPILSRQGSLWAFSGTGDREAHREIVELAPEGEPLSGLPAENPLESWTSPADFELPRLASTLLPGWILLSSGKDGKTGHLAEFQGENDVLVTQATPERPVTFARRLSIPPEGKVVFCLKVGHDPSNSWKLEIRGGTHTLLEDIIGKKPSTPGWEELEVDLSGDSGKTIWLLVSQNVDRGTPSHGYWKRLEVVDGGK